MADDFFAYKAVRENSDGFFFPIYHAHRSIDSKPVVAFVSRFINSECSARSCETNFRSRQAVLAANRVEEFRYRIADDRVFLFDTVHASATINLPDGKFGFAYMDFNGDEDQFYKEAQQAIELVRESTGFRSPEKM